MRIFGRKREHPQVALPLPLMPALPLPQGQSEEELLRFVSSIRVADAPPQEMLNYARCDFRRFVYTYGLASHCRGRALELGANPYFTTFLLRRFTNLDLTLANFFADGFPSQGAQQVAFMETPGSREQSVELRFDHFNIEAAQFPYADGSFETVFFCEIIEHLMQDPLRVLLEIRRILKGNGELILSTPNVARLENVAKLIAGENIYDPYSGYGPYGRHNREFNRHELHYLLTCAGFIPEAAFSADVHENNYAAYADPATVTRLVEFRKDDLGQYLFFRARKGPSEPTGKKPAYLYRSYPVEELVEWPPR